MALSTQITTQSKTMFGAGLNGQVIAAGFTAGQTTLNIVAAGVNIVFAECKPVTLNVAAETILLANTINSTGIVTLLANSTNGSDVVTPSALKFTRAGTTAQEVIVLILSKG
jgi:hypothetical protein